MEEEIFEKPCSAVLYRQSSIETVPSVGVNSFNENSDEKSLPKIVEVKVKDFSKIVCESYEDNSKDQTHDQFRNTLNYKNLTAHVPSRDKIESKEENQILDNSHNSIKKKPPPPPPPSKKRAQKCDTEERSVKSLSIPNFLQDLESKLSKHENGSSSAIYLEMKSPRSPRKFNEFDSKIISGVETKSRDCSSNNDDPNSSIYQEMKLVSSSETIAKETELINSSDFIEKARNGSKNLSDIYENVNRDIHIYQELQSNEYITPVALIKALKSKTQTAEEIEADIIDRSEENMATVRPKSPKPIISKNEKEESFWDKIGTLGRKKRIKEVQEVQEEGKYAIDSPGFAVTPYIPPEEYDLDENEERSIIMPKAFEDPRLRELIQVLIDWINDELASQRIIVQDLTEDLYDGQVFQKLFEMLTGHKLDVPEVTQSEEGQKQKLFVVLSHFNRVLGLPHNHNKWNVEVIHSKSIVPILHLLVALARHFRPPVRLPENVSVSVTVVQKMQGQLTHRIVREVLTSEYSDVGMRCERDAFDTLFDHAPEKLQVVKKSMVTFVNKHLNKLNLEVTEIETQFHDGVYLIMLMGLLEGFFVPLYSFFPTPKDNDQKVHNVSFAFELMEEVGLVRPKARPEDVVNLDLKSTLRVLYNLFNKYKSLL